MLAKLLELFKRYFPDITAIMMGKWKAITEENLEPSKKLAEGLESNTDKAIKDASKEVENPALGVDFVVDN